MSLSREEKIEACKDWLARRTARLDQLEKACEMQYFFVPPERNLARLDALESMRFVIEIHRWELEEFINSSDISEVEP